MFTFGSLGDIITVIQIVRQVIGALSDSTGSSRDYQNLICHLESLHRTLLEVDQAIGRSTGNGAQKLPRPTENAIRREVSLCNSIIKELLAKIEKYRTRLRKGGLESMMKDSRRKIGWQFFKKEDLVSFMTRLEAHTSAIDTLLQISTRSVISISTGPTSLNLQLLIHATNRIQGDIISLKSNQDAAQNQLMSLIDRLHSHQSVAFSEIIILKQLPPEILRFSEPPIRFTDALDRRLDLPFELCTNREVCYRDIKVRRDADRL
jgi:hypothetical protein